MSRYSRDEILIQGLELAHSAPVIQHDMPGNIIQPNAWSIKWLQSALDMFHRVYPFAGDVTSVAITLNAHNVDANLTSDISLYLPIDFIVDVRNGIEAPYGNTTYRLRKINSQLWLDYKIAYQTASGPRALCYAITNKRIKILPLLDTAQLATLYYYALAPEPGPEDAVDFPDEFTLIEYIRLRALEWGRSQGIPPGTGQEYLKKQLAMLRSSGLLQDSEYTFGQLENKQTISESMLRHRNSWMGGWNP